MTTGKIQQLLHGYRHGHELLSGSVRLASRDSEVVTRLSDLSGSLLGSSSFPPYLTVYPVPSGTYFALAKTWPDAQAGRAGCVLTHTLLVPMGLWTSLEAPRSLESLFEFPMQRSMERYASAIPVQEHRFFTDSTINYRDPDVLTFVLRYFGEGTRPIVWFGRDEPEEVVWRLLGRLWPKLRATFSACTLCLQPRNLDDRPFDLMFAPLVARSRFIKLKPHHFIEAGSSLPGSDETTNIEEWHRLWAWQLFGTGDKQRTSDHEELWGELDEDPTTIRRLFMLKELTSSVSPTPLTLVGAMDLVESLAKDAESAVAAKETAAKRAMQAAQDVEDPAIGLECLLLIQQRLGHQSFSQVRGTVGPSLVNAVASLTEKSPETTAHSRFLTLSDLDPKTSWVGQGFILGVRALADTRPDKLLALRLTHDVTQYLLSSAPEVGAAFVRAAVTRRENPEIRTDLLRWLRNIPDCDSRKKLRKSLLPVLGRNDVDILTELLEGLQADEVGDVLNELRHQTGQFEEPAILKLLTDRIAQGYPDETRAWAGQQRWTPGLAQIFAATYQPTEEGLRNLLAASGTLLGGQLAEAVAAFMEGLGSGSYPYWLTDMARRQSLLFTTLLDGDATPSPTRYAQIEKLLGEASTLQIAESPSFLQTVLASSHQPFFGKLLDLALQSVISGYVTGALDESTVRSFQEHAVVTSWFNSVAPSRLRELVIDSAGSSSERWVNAWRWMVIAPRCLYLREPTPLLEMIDSLERAHHWEWSDKVSDSWVQVLRRARVEVGGSQVHLMMCVQALKFSFEYSSLPLSPVAVEAFNPVYVAVTESPRLPPETAPLFTIFDWDKGKELRRNLIDSFLSSKWSPGDLILAVANVHLLRKVFKRLMRKRKGEKYAKAALADLRHSDDPNAASLARAWQDMLDNPDFYEDWD